MNARERQQTGEHALSTFLGRLKARGAPPPDPVVIDVFNESVDDLLRSTTHHEVVMSGHAAQYVGLAERIGRVFDEQLQEPLAAIALATSVLEPQLRLPQARRMKDINSASERIATMLRDLRDYSMCFAIGGLRLSRRRVDLHVVCARVVDSVRPIFPAQKIEIAGNTGDAECVGEWDADRIATLVSKLVVNAVEHGHPAGETVRLTLRSHSDRVTLDVWNSGHAPRSLERLFEPFMRAATYHLRASSGLGLGLFLAREIARAHGGTLEWQTGIHQGTTFRLTLPR